MSKVFRFDIIFCKFVTKIKKTAMKLITVVKVFGYRVQPSTGRPEESSSEPVVWDPVSACRVLFIDSINTVFPAWLQWVRDGEPRRLISILFFSFSSPGRCEENKSKGPGSRVLWFIMIVSIWNEFKRTAEERDHLRYTGSCKWGLKTVHGYNRIRAHDSLCN